MVERVFMRVSPPTPAYDKEAASHGESSLCAVDVAELGKNGTALLEDKGRRKATQEAADLLRLDLGWPPYRQSALCSECSSV